MECCRCGNKMFTASMVQIEQMTKDHVYKHATIHHECGTCGVTYYVFIPALALTKILRLRKG